MIGRAHCFGSLLALTVVMLPGKSWSAPEQKPVERIRPSTKPVGQGAEKIAEDIVEVRDKVLAAEEDSRKILGNLYEINQKIKKMSAKRNRLSDQMYSAKGDVSVLARSIARLEGRIEQQKRMLARRMRALYKLGEQGTLQAIFSSQSASELDRNLAYLKRVADRDYELIRDFEGNLKSLEESRTKLKKNVKRLVNLERLLKAQEKDLAQQQDSKSRLLTRLRGSRKAYLQQLKGLRQKAGGLAGESEIASLMNETFFERKGSLGLPTNGVISKAFGLDQHERFKFKLSHKGVFLSTKRGEPIKAVFPGEVSFVGKIPGYGNAVILDHGDHYYSVYCNGEKVEVKKGQKVSEGEVLGSAGRNSVGKPGLYFEIRHFSDPVDPTHWVNWSPDGEKTRL